MGHGRFALDQWAVTRSILCAKRICPTFFFHHTHIKKGTKKISIAVAKKEEKTCP